MNSFTGTCNLVKAPELRMTKTGKPVATIRGAFNTTRKDMNGEKVTLYMNIVVWGDFANTCAQTLERGDLIDVKGELQPREYVGRDGAKKLEVEIHSSEIVFMQRQPKNGTNRGGRYNGADEEGAYGESYLGDMEDVSDEVDLPF